MKVTFKRFILVLFGALLIGLVGSECYGAVNLGRIGCSECPGAYYPEKKDQHVHIKPRQQARVTTQPSATVPDEYVVVNKRSGWVDKLFGSVKRNIQGRMDVALTSQGYRNGYGPSGMHWRDWDRGKFTVHKNTGLIVPDRFYNNFNGLNLLKKKDREYYKQERKARKRFFRNFNNRSGSGRYIISIGR